MTSENRAYEALIGRVVAASIQIYKEKSPITWTEAIERAWCQELEIVRKDVEVALGRKIVGWWRDAEALFLSLG